MMAREMERHARPPVVHRTTCRMCDSTDLSVVLELEPTPPGDHYVTADALAVPQPAYPMTLAMCERCGLAQLPDVVDPEILYRDYIYNTSISLGLVHHFDRYAESVLARVGPPSGSTVRGIRPQWRSSAHPATRAGPARSSPCGGRSPTWRSPRGWMPNP